MTDKLVNAHRFLIRSRYRHIIEGKGFHDEQFLLNFCDEAQNINNPDKLSRWVGFLQGVLIERGVLDVKFERELTREIYKPIYEELGYDTTTVEVKK